MTNQSQSDHFHGTGPRRGVVENPRADPIERGRERGVVVTREESGVYIEHTPPVLPPPTLDASARGQLAQQVAHAESLVVEAKGRRAAAADKLAETQRLLVSATAADRWIEQKLLEDSTALTVEDNRLAAVTAHRDKLVADIKAWEAAGDLDAYESNRARQYEIDVMAPIEKGAHKVGAELGMLANNAGAAISTILAARREASRLAAKIGLARHRDSGIDLLSAKLRIAKAFVAGFCSKGHRADALRDWVGGR
jgi:hypothetical protein